MLLTSDANADLGKYREKEAHQVHVMMNIVIGLHTCALCNVHVWSTHGSASCQRIILLILQAGRQMTHTCSVSEQICYASAPERCGSDLLNCLACHPEAHHRWSYHRCQKTLNPVQQMACLRIVWAGKVGQSYWLITPIIHCVYLAQAL